MLIYPEPLAVSKLERKKLKEFFRERKEIRFWEFIEAKKEIKKTEKKMKEILPFLIKRRAVKAYDVLNCNLYR